MGFSENQIVLEKQVQTNLSFIELLVHYARLVTAQLNHQKCMFQLFKNKGNLP